jgi:LL-diaminopimelate aminotransferase
LLSRLSGGLVVDVGAPDFEMRLAILRNVAGERTADFGDGVLDEVARLPFGNVRELKGALNKITAYQQLDGTAVSAGDVRAVLGVTVAPVAPATPDRIQAIIPNGTDYDGFLADVPSASEATPDIIYLCSPNNPTGTVMDRARVEAWVAYALKHRAILFWDAAYESYNRSGAPKSIFEIEGARECAVEFRSFSKSGGFTGVRCGYTVMPKSLKAYTRAGDAVALHPLWTRRWNTRSNGVSYAVQRGAEALYTVEGKREVSALVDFYMENARILRDGCVKLGWKTWGGENAPYVWCKVPNGSDSWAFFERLLRDARVVTTPGAGFGRCGEGYFRISAFNSRANVEEVVRRLGSV